MYVSRIELSIPKDRQDELRAKAVAAHEAMRAMAGFRWAMLLRSLEVPGGWAAVSMWLTAEQAAAAQTGGVPGAAGPAQGYDVATARGAMTPATHVAIVDWEAGEDIAPGFVSRWNAAYHAIEDRLGSRLLRDLSAPGGYAGLHAVTEAANLEPAVLGAQLKDGEALLVTPVAVQRYEVVLLIEA